MQSLFGKVRDLLIFMNLVSFLGKTATLRTRLLYGDKVNKKNHNEKIGKYKIKQKGLFLHHTGYS